jgi:hypothetical protein
MKKTRYILFATLLLLVACNNEEVKEEDTSVEEQAETSQEVVEEAEVEEAPVDEPEEASIEETIVEEEQAVEELDVDQEVNETQEQETSSITAEEVNDIVNSYIGVDDTPVNVSFENGEIEATIDLVSDGTFPLEDLAVNRYSQLSDELLFYEGWEILTVTFPNVGTISMNRNEKETNEFGDYFPTLTIEERLN